MMETQAKPPVIKIRRKRLDWVIEFVSLFFLLILIALPLIFSKDLPEKVPVHFNLAGDPDRYGTRLSLWLLPLVGFVTYLGMTILESFPQIYNYPVKITAENIVKQYTMGTRLIRILKTVILIVYSFLSYQTIKTAMGNTIGLGKAFLPVSLLLTFGVIIIYIANSFNNRHSNNTM
jgi:uncharacterized membrane protein